MITIDPERCNHCNRCYLACPLELIDKGPVVRFENSDLCISCGHCYAMCPQQAIRVSGFEEVETSALSHHTKLGDSALLNLLRARRSERLYKNKPLAREHIEALLEAASVAPSSENTRSVKAYVYTDESILAAVSRATTDYYLGLGRLLRVPGLAFVWKLTGHLPKQLEHFKKSFSSLTKWREQPGRNLHKAKTLLVFTVPRRELGTGGDAWLAAENAVLYAETIGVGSCFNGFVAIAANNAARVKAALGIPREEKVVCALTLGYPKLRFAREAPRKRIETVWYLEPPKEQDYLTRSKEKA